MQENLAIPPPNESWEFMYKHMEVNQPFHKEIQQLREKYKKTEALLVSHRIIGSGISRPLGMSIDSRSHKIHRVESESGSSNKGGTL